MAVTYNMTRATAMMLTSGHLLAIGDSHTTQSPTGLWSRSWPIVSQINWVGMVAHCGNTGSTVHSTASMIIGDGTDPDISRWGSNGSAVYVTHSHQDMGNDDTNSNFPTVGTPDTKIAVSGGGGTFALGEVVTESSSGATGEFRIEVGGYVYLQRTTGVFEGGPGTLDGAVATRDVEGMESVASDGVMLRHAFGYVARRAIANSTGMENGIIINKRAGTVPANYPWPLVNNSKPWYHGRTLKAKVVYVGGSGAVAPSFPFGFFLHRIGTSANNASAEIQVTPAAGLAIQASGTTASLADLGTYDVTGTTIANDHDIRIRFTTGTGGGDETLKGFQPLACPVFAVDGSGDALAGCYFDHCGRTGMDAAEFLLYSASQANWASYIGATVSHPAKKICIWLMLTNLNATHYVGSAVTAQFTTDQEAAMDLLINAATTAGMAQIAPVLAMSWRGFNGVWTDDALCQSANAALLAICVRRGWGFFSFYEAFDGESPTGFTDLHAQTTVQSDLLASTLLSNLQAVVASGAQTKMNLLMGDSSGGDY
jgi:hypothetical protein